MTTETLITYMYWYDKLRKASRRTYAQSYKPRNKHTLSWLHFPLNA